MSQMARPANELEFVQWGLQLIHDLFEELQGDSGEVHFLLIRMNLLIIGARRREMTHVTPVVETSKRRRVAK